MLDHQLRSQENVSYVFIQRDGEILAHTFKKGLPSGLAEANRLSDAHRSHLRKIVSAQRVHYLDIAWPIFEGKAGVLRMGFYERLYRQKMGKLWLQMGAITLGVLVTAVFITLLFVKRITRPLAELTRATQKIDGGELGVRVQIGGADEVGKLAASFNTMVGRMEDYTKRLEEQTLDLERAHHQTRTSCSIVREIGALRGLEEIGAHLLARFNRILKCHNMRLILFSDTRDLLFSLALKGAEVCKDPGEIQKAFSIVTGISKTKFTADMPFGPPLVSEAFQAGKRQAILPLLSENQAFGALVLACPGQCDCSTDDIDAAGMILNQAAGVIKRAVTEEEEVHDLQRRLETQAEFHGLVGKDPKMQVIYRLIEDIAPTDATVLIQGESGTGKELVANAIHEKSSRKGRPFIVINCSAYPDTLLESELFGHEKGAFTGAIRQKAGRFEQADGGTVFLDEIGEIPPSAQIKLLRVLQSHQFERLGGEHILTVDVRIISATNKDLLTEVKNGRFREDLFYRINVIPVNMPPLRDRLNDIPLLARHFARRFAREQDKKIKGVSEDAMRLLLDHSWPGNVRELKNSIEHAAVLARGERIEASDLPTGLHSPPSHERPSGELTMAEHERELLTHALEECGWNKKQAASRLGISRNTLYVKIKKYQIEPPTTH
ncbi:MAG: sigma 54-interacting transcriptional regulator [Deltaproteobacteria bacterium]|nr:sigma 54-interacting transcriptional regulator [Deltaproteobacteria bacterium]